MATVKHDKECCTRIAIKLNNRTDADILAKLDTEENKQGYIKSLIRADMEKNQPEKVD